MSARSPDPRPHIIIEYTGEQRDPGWETDHNPLHVPIESPAMYDIIVKVFHRLLTEPEPLSQLSLTEFLTDAQREEIEARFKKKILEMGFDPDTGVRKTTRWFTAQQALAYIETLLTEGEESYEFTLKPTGDPDQTQYEIGIVQLGWSDDDNAFVPRSDVENNGSELPGDNTL
ncbi:hypothetical protein [Haladaptatus sp. QDMS2]|nr:hypothetical protein [Haladaptatus sp. QDMS2]